MIQLGTPRFGMLFIFIYTARYKKDQQYKTGLPINPAHLTSNFWILNTRPNPQYFIPMVVSILYTVHHHIINIVKQ